MLKIILLIASIMFWSTAAIAAGAWGATVFSVQDGDSIIVLDAEQRKHRIRLYGIDCPEIGQAWGEEASKYMRQLLYPGSKVVIEVKDVDNYKRKVSIVTLANDGRTAQEYLLMTGLAWIFRRYCKDDFCWQWKQLESRAQQERQGLWSDREPIAPWKWRQLTR